MLNNSDMERLESELRIQAANHQPRLSLEASARIQKRVYGQLRRAIMVQRRVKPVVAYTALAILVILVVAGIAILDQSVLKKGSLQINSTSTPTPTPSPTQLPAATQTPTPGPTIVRYYAATYSSTDPYHLPEYGVLTSLIYSFNAQHPDIRITLVENIDIPTDDVLTSLAGQADCFTLPVPQTYQSDAAVLDINTLANAEGPNYLADFDPAMLADFRRQGKLMALPAVSAPIEVMFYNRDLLTQLGLQPPTQDWTFDDFVRLIQAVASPQDGIYGFEYYGEDFFLRGHGAQWVDPASDPIYIQINSTEMNDTLVWLVELKNSGALIMATESNRPEVEAKIGAGKVAFWISSGGWLDTTFMDHTPSFSIGTITMPKLSGYRYPYYWYDERGHFISTRSSNVQACWSWIKFLSQQKEAFSGIPGRLSLLPQWEAFAGTTVYETEYRRDQRYDFNTSYYKIGEWPFNWWVNRAILSAFNGQDIKHTLDATQAKAEDYLTCWNGADLALFTGSKLIEQIQYCAKQVDPSWPFSP